MPPPDTPPIGVLDSVPVVRPWNEAVEQEQMWPAGALYIVATPIGNLRDITLRALDCLARVDAIAAEDTRMAQRLLNAYGLRVPTFALYRHNEAGAAAAVIARLALGERVAYISDAGTPGISDPGAKLVRLVRAAGFAIIPLPGASALTAAVSVAGLPDAPLVFCGFLPAKTGLAKRALAQLALPHANLVFYEAPHRVVATLELLAETFGAARAALIARELTKLYETIHAGTLGDLARQYAERDKARGEFVILIEAEADSGDEGLDAGQLRLLSRLLLALPLSEAVNLTAELSGLSRKRVYAIALALKGRD